MTDGPTTQEIRQYLISLGFPLGARGNLPAGAYVRWNRDHPDRPVAVPEFVTGLPERHWRRWDFSRPGQRPRKES